ncbi:glucosyltransferase domain-containing protein [Peptacetobacter sp. AB845]|uniref:glucosyltransferase domain-containing protein n=1 Tax=Peptacetobacter sp. AB845 TaxID=3388429 RepID=UPI0039C96700
MGEEILQFYREKLKKEYKIAFISTFIIVMLVHIYKFTNSLPNHDTVYNYYANQNMIGSGRWALSWACGMSSYYDLPWINGLMSCIFISLTVVVIVALFKMKNPVLIGLTGGLLAAAPATTETIFFLFTADGYMVSMFLAALGVYFSRIEEKSKLKLVLGIVCICVSCGIYQAYVSFALILAICYFINELLKNNYEKKEYFKWIFKQIIVYTIALASYYVIWKLSMRFTGVAANSYQGISEVGKIKKGFIKEGLLRSIKPIALYFLQWNVFRYGFTLYSVLNLIFLGTMFLGMIISVIKSGIFKRVWAMILVIFCLIAIVPFSCIWNFASSTVEYRLMMLQCLTVLFILTAVLYEQWFKPILKNAVCLLLLVIVINNAIMANISYFYMNLCYEQTYATGLEMISKIHNLDDKYDFEKIAVLGNIQDRFKYEKFNKETGEILPMSKVYMFTSLLEENLLYDSYHVTKFLRTTFGLDLINLSKENRNKLLDDKRVKAMKTWPSDESINVVDDILVIKLSEDKEGE